MNTAAQITSLAAQTGCRSEVVEKVLRLLGRKRELGGHLHQLADRLEGLAAAAGSAAPAGRFSFAPEGPHQLPARLDVGPGFPAAGRVCLRELNSQCRLGIDDLSILVVEPQIHDQ